MTQSQWLYIERLMLLIYGFLVVAEAWIGSYYFRGSYYIFLPFVYLVFLIGMFLRNGINCHRGIVSSFVFFMLWMGVSLIWAKEVQGVMFTFAMQLIGMITALVFIMRGLDGRDFEYINAGTVLGALVVSLSVLTDGDLVNGYLNQGLVGRTSMTDVTGNGYTDPNFTSLVLLYPLFIVYQSIFKPGLKRRLVGGICALMIASCVLMTGSRGAILAIILTFFCKSLYEKKYFLCLLVGAIIMVLLFFAVEFVSEVVGDRFTLEMMLEKGGSRRVDIWVVALQMVKENILCGVGFNNFPNCYYEYAMRSSVGGSLGVLRIPHNAYLEIWSELGTVGLITFLYLLYESVASSFNDIMKRNGGIFWGVLAFLIAAFFLSISANKLFWFFISLPAAYVVRNKDC